MTKMRYYSKYAHGSAMILVWYGSKLKVRKSHKIRQKSNMKLLFNFSVEILLEKRYPTLRGFGLKRQNQNEKNR